MKYRSITLTLFSLCLLIVAIAPVNAQPASDKTYKIANFLWFSTGAFQRQMTELGYVEGQNITYLSVSFEGFDKMTPEEANTSLQNQIQSIMDAKPDLIVTNTDTDAVNTRASAGDIPIVFARSDDPVATGAVADLVNPGGFTTGLITNRPHERRLQILTEVLPSTDKILYLYSPLTGESETVLEQVRKVGADLNVEVVAAPVTDGPTAIEALANMPDGVDWFFMTPYVPYDPAFYEVLNKTSLDDKIGIAGVVDSPTKGYVVGYGPNIDDSDAQAARMADRILRGASPADLPVEIAENYLTINLEAADAIGLAVPEAVLRQANLIVRPGYFDSVPGLTPTPAN